MVAYYVAMFIDIIPNRASPPAVLLREAWREGKKIRKRTLANLSALSAEQIDALRCILRGETLVRACDHLAIERSWPHGHVAAVLGTLRHLGLETMLASRPSPERTRVVAMIAARILAPASKLATARGLDAETTDSTLGQELGLHDVDAESLYAALDWLDARQARIEATLGRRHLAEGMLLLYDVTSSYFEGHTSALGQLGHNRDGTGWLPQIVIGLLCTSEGCPVAVEVFPGNTSDPKTLRAAVTKARERFGLTRVVLVGDRGLITEARITQDLRGADDPAGLEWITALRAPAIRALVEEGDLQLSLFDAQDLGDLTSDAYPGERLIACRNPLLATERARKRVELLAATERDLAVIVTATQRTRRPLRGQDQIGVRVGRVLGRFKMAKHFTYTITDTDFTYVRDEVRIAAEAALDGIYVIRTNVPAATLGATDVVAAYKDLAHVERAFRTFKSPELDVRPIYHRKDARIRAHVFVCMLAYYVVWHMRRSLAPLLFQDADPVAARARRRSIVAPAMRSAAAERKIARRTTEDGTPLHSFRTLLRDLATLTRNTVRLGEARFQQLTTPTPLHERVFQLLGVRP
jgi:hypothetical protein